jgi:hypothetical protein
MLLRAGGVWVAILVLAILNGGFRQALLIPLMGEAWGKVASTLLLMALVAATAYISMSWIGARGATEGFQIGLLWTALTLAFEFLAGHYLFGNSWESLAADYNIAKGRLWILVPLTTLIAPLLAARSR